MPDSPLITRLENIRRALADKGIDALLLTDIVNIGYLTGFTGSTAYALVTPDEALLITDPRYTLRARQECPQFETVLAAGSGSYGEALKETLTARPGLQRLGFEAGRLTYAQWQKLAGEYPAPREWVPTENLVEDLRLIKDDREIAAIRRAIAVAEAAFETIKPRLRPGVEEREVALELEFAMRRGGSQDRSFETIVASGAQGARPHHTPNDRPLVSGDLVTLDWGAVVDGYASDITRTVGIGRITEKQRQVHEAVRESQRRAIAAIRHGRTGKEVDSVARDYLTSQGYGEAFGHSLGHSIGRSVHDSTAPALSQRGEEFVLKPGMVLTVEPGVYLENWGGVRIEEDVLVTEDGCEILTSLPNALEVYG